MGSLGTLPDPLDINDRTDTTITAADEIVYADATDSAAIKKDTVQGILDLVPAVANNAITLAKMASGTDGNIISYDASGDPVAIATGSDGQVLTSTGAGSPPAFEALPGGGKVLQVVSNHVNTASSQSMSADTPVSISNLNASITCASTGSKVRIDIVWNGEVGNVATEDVMMGMHRGTTLIGQAPGASSRGVGMTSISAGYQTEQGSSADFASYSYIDSPGSTSELTYHAMIVSWVFASTIYNNRTVADGDNQAYERLTSTIILTELSAATTQVNGS